MISMGQLFLKAVKVILNKILRAGILTVSILTVLTGNSFSQITGKVLDQQTGYPLAGVHIFLEETPYGTTSGDDWSPGFNIAYQFNKRTMIRTGWGIYHQVHNIDGLYMADDDYNYYDSESSMHIIVWI